MPQSARETLMNAPTRKQQTISQPAQVSGFGLFGSADVTLTFLPADENHGIAFQRTDLIDSQPIPATIDYLEPSHRRTAIANDTARVEMIEHVMAALAGLQIDNCLVQLDAVEAPGMDGSSIDFCKALLDAGVVTQKADREFHVVRSIETVKSDDLTAEIQIRPHVRRIQALTYHLDYGTRSPVRPQTFSSEINPDSFVNEIAFARTFVLESEIEALKAAGYGAKATTDNLLAFRNDGTIINNQLRAPNECVRHKILDCIGDLALLGCDIYGHFSAWRSGHDLNHRTVKRLQQQNVLPGRQRHVA